MGLGLLPWEKLPAYVFGPFLCVLNIWLFAIGDPSLNWHWFWQFAGFAIGAWVIWYRYKTGKEPFATEKKEDAPDVTNDTNRK